ncbi:MAG TPA: DNA methyltransferase [Patescibacteria group bacterium]
MLDYQDFLASKRTIAQTSGIEVSLEDIHDGLFPFQKVLVQWALRKGRAAIFADTGLGKTRIQTEYAHLISILTNKRVLIIAPLSVASQTVSEAAKIGVHVVYVRDGKEVDSAISITNYEMIDHFNFDDFGCIILDESSILKNLTGATCQKLIEKSKGIPYKLGCTATPAPNDFVELGNHAEFLEIMTGQEMKSQFFVHDAKSSAHGGWRLKGHATDVFYQWLASWSMSVKKPSDLSSTFSDEGYNLPPLHVERAIVTCDYVPEGQLFFSGLKGVSDRAKVRKGTLEDRVKEAVKLIDNDENNEQWIIWTGLNDESSIVSRAISGAVELTGSDSPDKKIQTIQDFQDGKIRVLVTKAKIAGMGINLQNCHNQIWLGLTDSFEIYYQGVRRSLRFGQEYPVWVYIVLSDIEEEIFQNVLRKEEEAKKMSDELIKNVQQFEKDEIEHKQEKKFEYGEDIIKNDDYTLMLGDSCERLKEMASNSIDLLVSSIPFEHLYTYTPTERDLGNSRTSEEFFTHLDYIIDELMRVMKPGRNMCVHVSQIPLTLISDGVIGIRDFRGDVIRAFIKHGFIYHSDITVDKNPQVAASRSHAKGLAFQQLEKDTSEMRSTFADYVLVFKKPGKNVVPVKQQLTKDEWIKWASAVWYGIRQTDTLNVKEAREAKDEMHICPLQLDLIERLLRLYSNPGEMVLDPFAGIGSTGYVALGLNRKFVGIELKPSYFKTSVKNLNRVLKQRTQGTLWDMAEVS